MKLKELIVADENQNLSWENNLIDTSYGNENLSKGMNDNWFEGRNDNWSEERKEIGPKEDIQRRKRRIHILHYYRTRIPVLHLRRSRIHSSPLENQYNIAQVTGNL